MSENVKVNPEVEEFKAKIFSTAQNIVTEKWPAKIIRLDQLLNVRVLLSSFDLVHCNRAHPCNRFMVHGDMWRYRPLFVGC